MENSNRIEMFKRSTMKSLQPTRIKTIADYHNLRKLPKADHPLISVLRFEDIKITPEQLPESLITDLYLIALKHNFNGKLKYGQHQYDFDDGVALFLAPGQIYTVEADDELQHSGWLLLIHPDYLWNTSLAASIHKYDFFHYHVSEALHLSEKEEKLLTEIVKLIAEEYCARIDKYSESVIISQLELLLTYSERFYNRQFITRKIQNHRILSRFEEILADYFNRESFLVEGLPTVTCLAEKLNISQSYLSATLKTLTGQSTQQLIQNKVIEKAKEKLSTTDLSVSEIAYALGFEHPQSFNKLFKNKTQMSPQKFRQSFKSN
jgi:AraC-like DNA-binding protein